MFLLLGWPCPPTQSALWEFTAYRQTSASNISPPIQSQARKADGGTKTYFFWSCRAIGRGCLGQLHPKQSSGGSLCSTRAHHHCQVQSQLAPYNSCCCHAFSCSYCLLFLLPPSLPGLSTSFLHCLLHLTPQLLLLLLALAVVLHLGQPPADCLVLTCRCCDTGEGYQKAGWEVEAA